MSVSRTSVFRYVFEWLLDERVILLYGSIAFAAFAVLLIHWNVNAVYVTSFIGFVNMLLGALIRGIITQKGGNNRETNPGPESNPSSENVPGSKDTPDAVPVVPASPPVA